MQALGEIIKVKHPGTHELTETSLTVTLSLPAPKGKRKAHTQGKDTHRPRDLSKRAGLHTW